MVEKYLKTGGKKFDINSDLRNFVWAENGFNVHSVDSAEMVYDKLKAARNFAKKKNHNVGSAIETALSELGDIFNKMR